MDKEYIERKKVVEYLRSRAGTYYDDIGRSWSAGMEAAASACEKFPAADVVEVVHGRWEKFIATGEDSHGNSVKIVFECNCSICGHDGRELTNYCPNCGARMDGE